MKKKRSVQERETRRREDANLYNQAFLHGYRLAKEEEERKVRKANDQK